MSDISPFQYTSRTFTTLLADINADPRLADKPEWIKRLIAGIGDVVSMWNNAAANDAYLPTAFTRSAVRKLCALIDYTLSEPTPATGTLIFEVLGSLTTASFTAAELAAVTRGSAAMPALRFESRAAGALAVVTDVVDLTANPPSGNAVLVARSFLTGEKVRVSGSSLPAGLAAGTDYWTIRVDATHIKFASSRSNAYAGTNLTVTGGSGNMTTTLKSFLATVYQQESVASASIGKGDSVTPWLELALPDLLALEDTLAIVINSVPWTRVDNFAFSGASDTHYQLDFKTDGTPIIRFGDGVYGAIPAAFDVYASYAKGGGVEGNVSALAISAYAGTNASITGVSNPSSMTGGTDAESMDTARRIAPGLLKARDRFVTADDAEFLVLAYGGVALAKVDSNYYGVLSARVIGIATGGGNPNSTLRDAIRDYLIARSVMSVVDVRFPACTITSTAVTSAVKVKPGYLWATIQPYVRLAWKLFLTETGEEILTAYRDLGLAYAVQRINAILTESFAETDAQVLYLLERFDEVGGRNFEDSIQESDAFSFIQGGVRGIDYLTIAAPAFPLTLAPDEITTPGAITLTEVP